MKRHKQNVLAGGLCLALLSGCRTPVYDVDGREFTRLVKNGRFGEYYELSRSVWGRYYYADYSVLPPTQSLPWFEKRFRTTSRELTAEQFEDLQKARESNPIQLAPARGFFKAAP